MLFTLVGILRVFWIPTFSIIIFTGVHKPHKNRLFHISCSLHLFLYQICPHLCLKTFLFQRWQLLFMKLILREHAIFILLHRNVCNLKYRAIMPLVKVNNVYCLHLVRGHCSFKPADQEIYYWKKIHTLYHSCVLVKFRMSSKNDSRQFVVLVLTLLVCYSGESLGKAEKWKENCPKKKLAWNEVRRGRCWENVRKYFLLQFVVVFVKRGKKLSTTAALWLNCWAESTAVSSFFPS